MRPTAILFVVLALTVGAVLIGGAPARAAVAYQLTVTESAPSYQYGQTPPSFRASLVPPADDPSPNPNTQYYIVVGSLKLYGSVDWSSSPYSLFVNSLDPTALPGGQYTVVAQYVSPNHGVLSSAPITLTVDRSPADVHCTIVNPTATYTAGASITFSANPVLAGGSYSVTFAGPQTVSSPWMQPDGSGDFVVNAPGADAVYNVTCNFSGSAALNPGSWRPGPLIVSAGHPIAGIRLYTDPAPLESYTATNWEVVVIGSAGLPAPTGSVSLRMGTAFTKQIALTSDGTVTFQATSPGVGSGATIQVAYTGDPVYASSVELLSPNTAPIAAGGGTRPPAGAGPGASGGGLPASPAEGTPSPSPASSTSLSGAPASIARVVPALSTFVAAKRSGDAVRYVIAAGAALALLAAVSVGLILRRRRRRLPAP